MRLTGENKRRRGRERLKKKGKERLGYEGSSKLRRLISTINYDSARKGERRGEGSSQALQSMVGQIISLNVRGINDYKRGIIKGCMSRWNLEVICLQENKMEAISERFVRNL